VTLPLEGLRVLDLGISTAGPYAARFIADMGAEVIKVEPLDGENSRGLSLRFGGVGYLFHVNNYNKKSVALNVQSETGRKLFLELVAKSDAVIENFALGTMDRWGIGYEACRAANPSIVYGTAKGFGLNGPEAGKRAFDTVVQAMSGIMDMTGKLGDPPLKAGPSACDLMTAMATATAVMTGLVSRVEGESQLLDAALFDMGALSMLPFWPAACRGEGGIHSLGNAHPKHAPFGAYSCADGPVMVSVTTDEQWHALARLLGLPASWGRVERKKHEKNIEAALSVWLAKRTGWEAASLLQESKIPAAPVLDVAQAASAPQLESDRPLISIGHPIYGEMSLIRSPVVAAGDVGIRLQQPTLGEHNEEIIGGLLGYQEELPRLRSEGVIG
jgi:crotonobetainyl-CoA:carnitine CoA-transferase CaiB-like acyl-CoA transferase